MKINTYLFFALMLIFTTACSDKDDDLNPLEKEVEKDLTIKSGERMYSDSLGNKYHTMEFDLDHLKHLYKMNLIEGRKYRITLTGEYNAFIKFALMKTERDIVFFDDTTSIQHYRNQHYWAAPSGGTFYLLAEVIKNDIFQTASNRLIFEEITPFELSVGNMQFLCSGDWSVNEEGYLTFGMHETMSYNWAKVLNHSSNYRFLYDVTQASGIPDNFIGIDCFASDDLYAYENIPHTGYVFEVKGPSEFRIDTWFGEGVSLHSGGLIEDIPSGSNYWHSIGVQIDGDSIIFIADGEIPFGFSNYISSYTGLYITVYDNKQDTVYFKDIKLEE